MNTSWLSTSYPLLGPLIRIPRAEVIEILALGGFDFGVIDLEHGPIAHNEVYPLVLAAERHGFPLLARLPGLQESYVKWLLDIGIAGLQIPHIKTADDARSAVAMSKFAPVGERGLCRFTRAAEFSNIPKEEYVCTANLRNILVLQIEGKEGVENIEEICAVPGVDVIFVGPYDLSQSLGLIGQIWHEKVVEKVTKVVKACDKVGIRAGVFTDTPEGLTHWSKLGIHYLNYRIEAEMFLTAIKQRVVEARNSIGRK